MKHSTGKPTKAEADRIDDFRLIGCVACYMLGYPQTPYDVHHFIDGNRRIGHFASAPICPPHHRGVGFKQWLHVASIAIDQTAFRAAFGTDYELQCLTDRLIALKRRQAGLPAREALSEAETRPSSWRVCPECKSRATKLYSLSTGKYQCQICNHEYEVGHEGE